MTAWLPLDCHAHTMMSDGALSVRQLVDVAVGRGVRPSVADHVSRDVAGSIKSVDELREYLTILERHPVLRAGEFCWHDDLWREIPDDVASRFHHRIGSMHAVHLPDGTLAHAFSRRLPADLTATVFMAAHADDVERMAAEMPIDIFAHPTLVALPFREIDPLELWSERHEERVVTALAAAGIAFEISARYPPHERIVARAIARGVRISLGSDGHTARQVADVSAPLEMARRLGVRDGDLYDPEVHGSRGTRSSRPRA